MSKAGYPKNVQSGVPNLSPCPGGWVQAPLVNYLEEVPRSMQMADDEEYRLVTVKRARGGVVERERKMGREVLVKNQFYVRSGDFLISKRQIVHGACGLVPEELDGSIVSNEYSVLRGNEDIDLTFLNYLAHSVYFQQTCFHSSVGVHVEKMIFKLDQWLRWPFNLPPLKEQQRIAEILGTWDEAIDTVEALIENSQTQKNVLMQKLLNGYCRLPGFNEEWKFVPLSNEFLSRKQKGKIVPCNEEGRGLPYIGSASFFGQFSTYTDSEKALFCDPLDVLVLWDGEYAGKSTTGLAGAVSSTVVKYELDSNKIDNFFLVNLLTFDIERIRAIREGSGIPHMPKDFESWYRFKLPPVEEQVAISKRLTDADQIVTSLIEKLDILKKEKAALMQQLFSGKRRVKSTSKTTSQKEAVNASK